MNHYFSTALLRALLYLVYIIIHFAFTHTNVTFSVATFWMIKDKMSTRGYAKIFLHNCCYCWIIYHCVNRAISGYNKNRKHHYTIPNDSYLQPNLFLPSTQTFLRVYVYNDLNWRLVKSKYCVSLCKWL